MLKIGYRYTTSKDWEEIEKKGYLIPRKIISGGFEEFFEKPIKGIWIWENPSLGRDHVGSLIQQATWRRNSELIIYLLEVMYHTEWLLVDPKTKRDFIITPEYTVGEQMFTGRRAAIIAKRVPKKFVRVLKVYDLKKLLI